VTNAFVSAARGDSRHSRKRSAPGIDPEPYQYGSGLMPGKPG
jgi:hypothetical protein